MSKIAIRSLRAIVVLICVSFPKPSQAQNGLQKVNHIIVVMQENHSFDNYFGALSYAPGSRYHRPSGTGLCDPDDRRRFELHGGRYRDFTLLQFEP